MRAKRRLVTAVVVAASLAFVPLSLAAPRVEYRGVALSARQMERLLAPALEAPSDSSRLSDALGDVVAQLENLGYLDARAEAEWKGAGHERLAVTLREGARYRLASIDVHAPNATDSSEIRRALGLSIGAWVSPAGVAQSLQAALDGFTEDGYPYATIGVRSWDTDSARVRLGVTGTLGPRVTITDVRVEGLKVTRADVAEKSMGRIKGQPYSRTAGLAARERLLQLGLFQDVSYQGLEGEADWSRGRLVYRVAEPRYNRFEAALGMQGQAGTAGLVRIDLDNLLGTGRALGLNWESHGRGIMQFGARYAEPMIFGAPIRLEGTFNQEVQDTLFARTRFGARGRLALSTTERVEVGYQEERVVQDQTDVAEARLQTTSLALERGTLDLPVTPRRGTRVRVSLGSTRKTEHLRTEGTTGAHSGQYQLDGEWHRPFGPASGLAVEIQARGTFSSERVLPAFELLPLGGARSLRGYDEEQFHVDRYALARTEWRWFLGGPGQRIALFWDHALAATRVALPEGGDRNQILGRDGVGFGLRLEAAGSLIGLDYGLEPGRPPLEGKIHLQLVSTF